MSDLKTQVVAVVHLIENLLDEGIRVTQLRVGSPQPRIQALPGGEPDQELLDVAPLRGVPSIVVVADRRHVRDERRQCERLFQRLEVHTHAQVGPRAVLVPSRRRIRARPTLAAPLWALQLVRLATTKGQSVDSPFRRLSSTLSIVSVSFRPLRWSAW